jgi:hypothetical protein
MCPLRIVDNRLELGERFAVSFQRTLRIPDDGRVYPLPPTLGVFRVHPARDYAGRLPAAWLDEAFGEAVFIAMYQREALWLAFEAPSWKPCAVKIGVGRIDALTGQAWQEGLHADPQDYLVCPAQPWLDGIKTRQGVVRQFVAMPLGQGYTIEGQLTGEERHGGLQLAVHDPQPGRFPDRPPPQPVFPPALAAVGPGLGGPLMGAPLQGMGLAAGGQLQQKIYPDPYGLDAWQQTASGRLQVYLLNSLQYTQVTGQPPPSSPVSARSYTEHGFPWFALYDEAQGDLPVPPALAGVQSVRQVEDARGIPPGEEETTVEIDPGQVQQLDDSQFRRNDNGK